MSDETIVKKITDASFLTVVSGILIATCYVLNKIDENDYRIKKLFSRLEEFEKTHELKK